MSFLFFYFLYPFKDPITFFFLISTLIMIVLAVFGKRDRGGLD